MKPETQRAIRAARNRHIWGRHAATTYAKDCPALYRLACQLEAAQKVVDLMPEHLKRQAY